MGLDALLLPVAPDAPAGPDLSYDPARQEIEQAFDLPSDEVDWDRTVSLIEAEAGRTRDVWLAVYLARAGARAGDLGVVEQGVSLLAGLFERFWDTAHPTLEEYGVEGRKGACESLVRIGEFLAPLRRAALVEHPRLGSFSGADFERFAQDGAAAMGYGQFRAAVADTPLDRLSAALDRIGRIREGVERADAVLSEQAGLAGQTGTNFGPTYEALDAVARAVRPYAGGEPAGAADADASPTAAEPSGDGAARGAPGRVGSREDVARALDAVIDYYRRAEPSSPVPVALARIKGWIAMDFMAILQDIAPGGAGEAANVLRGRSEESGSSDLM